MLPHLSGERAAIGPRASQVAANDDRSAVLAWLARYKRIHQPRWQSYRKEAEGCCLVCAPARKGPVRSDPRGLSGYESFLEDPQPAESMGHAGRAEGSGVLAPLASVRRSPGPAEPAPGTVDPQQPLQLAGFKLGIWRAIPWLCAAANQWRDPPRPAGFCPTSTGRKCAQRLSPFPTGTPRLALQAARYRWLFSLLYIGGLRISRSVTTRWATFTGDGGRRTGALVAGDSWQGEKPE